MARFYVTSVEHNKEKDAENRSVPFAFDQYDKARAKFHSIMASDINNSTLDWAVAIIWDDSGTVLDSEKWHENDEG